MSARVSALVLVVLVGVGAFALDSSAPEPDRGVRVAASAIDGPVIPPDGAVSVAWFCAEGTSTPDGRATETIIVGNLADHPVDVTITVMPGGGDEPVSDQRQLDTLGQLRVPVADILETAEPGVIVEIVGGPAIVEHEVRDGDDLAVGPCAREASPQWFFAAGSTDRGAEEWLALFNPFGDDAIVDVTFLTDSGSQVPGATQGFVVPRHSRVSLPVHEQIARQERVAVSIRARVGRIVAERTVRFDGTDTRKGMAVSLGVTDAARRWRLPAGDARTGAAQSLSIANFGDVPTTAELRVTVGGSDEGEFEDEVDVPARSVVQVDLGTLVSTDVAYSVDVRDTGPSPIVVESFGSWAEPSDVVGVATATGSVTTSRRWAFALGRADENGSGILSAVNVGDRPVTVQVYAYTAGNPNSPTSAPQAAVGPGERVEFRVQELGIGPEMVLVVVADGPIVVARQLDGNGVSVSPGIPARRS